MGLSAAANLKEALVKAPVHVNMEIYILDTEREREREREREGRTEEGRVGGPVASRLLAHISKLSFGHVSDDARLIPKFIFRLRRQQRLPLHGGASRWDRRHPGLEMEDIGECRMGAWC